MPASSWSARAGSAGRAATAPPSAAAGSSSARAGAPEESAAAKMLTAARPSASRRLMIKGFDFIRAAKTIHCVAPRFVLASFSPRRRALLMERGFAFEVVPADVDETMPAGEPAVEAAARLATEKALVTRARVGEDAVVLGADTCVVCETEILEIGRASC